MNETNFPEPKRQLSEISGCETIIWDAFWFLILSSVIMLVVSIVSKQFLNYIFDVCLMIFMAFVLLKYKSRTMSFIILLYSLLVCYSTVMMKIASGAIKTFGGISNVVITSLLVFFAFRALLATICLFRLKKYSINWKNFFIKTGISILFAVLTCALAIYLGLAFKSEVVLVFGFWIAIILSLFLGYAGIFPKSDKFRIRYIKDEVKTENI